MLCLFCDKLDKVKTGGINNNLAAPAPWGRKLQGIVQIAQVRTTENIFKAVITSFLTMYKQALEIACLYIGRMSRRNFLI